MSGVVYGVEFHNPLVADVGGPGHPVPVPVLVTARQVRMPIVSGLFGFGAGNGIAEFSLDLLIVRDSSLASCGSFADQLRSPSPPVVDAQSAAIPAAQTAFVIDLDVLRQPTRSLIVDLSKANGVSTEGSLFRRVPLEFELRDQSVS